MILGEKPPDEAQAATIPFGIAAFANVRERRTPPDDSEKPDSIPFA